MINYNNYGVRLESDFDIRPIYEDGVDLDLFIPLNDRPLNLFMEGLPAYLDGRIQLKSVGNLIFRLAKDEKNTRATLHFLKNIDIQSSIINLELDYREILISIREEDGANGLYIELVS